MKTFEQFMFIVLDPFIDINLINSQEPATYPYPEPDKSSPYTHIPLPEDPS